MPRKRDKLGDQISEMVEASILQKARKLAPAALPDGVITVLFTDVEGSTELVRDKGDAEARAILRRHDELVRKVLKEHDGVEVERAGDAFMLAFRFPTRAVAFALALHDRLSGDGDLRVRIGMDTGEVIREEKGYFGRTVFRASRIAELGNGGQVLASEATKVLAEASPGARFADLGEKELDGLGGRHRVFEVLAFEPPA
ncbi:MAG TPA: adenylate/guanylate cyclase domain-containing protein [Actinomycetota bacterium]